MNIYFILSISILNIFLLSVININAAALGTDEKEFIEKAYVPTAVTYDATEEAKKILLSMSPSLLPITPEGYKWVKGPEGAVALYKHETVPAHDIEIVVYGPDTKGKVNYVVRIDGRNRQSFAHTRAKTLHAAYRRIPFKERDEYMVEGEDHYFMPGHCIDHADTIEVGRHFDMTNKLQHYPKPIPLLESPRADGRYYSTYDWRNFIPEPPNSDWGRFVRNPLVRSIRKNKGAYMQIPYYSDYKLAGESTCRFTRSRIAVPDGVYFAEYFGERIGKIYDVTWDHEFPDRGRGVSYAHKELISEKDFVPFPLFYDPNVACASLKSTIKKYKDKYSGHKFRLCTWHEPYSHYQIHAAEIEFLTPYHKIWLAINFSEGAENAAQAAIWLKRAATHAEYLDEEIADNRIIITDSQYDDFKYSFENECAGFSDPHERKQDFWRQIYGNQEDRRTEA